MKPLFTYQIPESSWYIVITDNSKHFYFNNEDKSSHWQLSDLQVEYGLDIPRFVDSINFDEIGLLMAKSRGVGFKKEEVKKELPIDNTPKEEEIVIENVQPQQEPEQSKQEPKSILQGYSSSEEEESEDEHDINIDELTSQAIAQYQKPEEPASESDGEDNESLDLSVDEETSNTAEQDFINLLDRFSSKISIYDPWDLIEEELINEFSQNPEFFAISSKQERETIFQKWCSNQESTQNEMTGIYPTPKLKFLNFLQEYKSEIKDSYYQSFYSSHYQPINEIDLPSSTKETIFRSFKIMLNDFTKFAKNYKKQNKNSNQNVKVMKLSEFLYDKISGSYDIDEKLSDFDNWIKLLNKNDISANIAENEINFLVGDEKRLHTYIQQLK